MLSHILKEISRIENIMQRMGHLYEIEVHINTDHMSELFADMPIGVYATKIASYKVQYWKFEDDSDERFRVYTRHKKSDSK